ncbi:MAG: S8 family peptidase [Lysobacteraceae bacterium]
MSLRVLLFALLCAAIACARAAPPGAATTPGTQLLLMLRTPPPHYRPATAYLGEAYRDAPGHAARRRAARALAAAQGLRLRDDWPMPALQVDCFVLEAPDADSAARAARALARDPRVDSVEPMQEFRVLGGGDPLAPAQPVTRAWRLPELHALATGRGVRVAVVDSGVAASHPDLRGQVDVQRNFVDARPDPGEAHGTAVAGIIAARADDGVGIAGVAPGARLLALRACWQQDAAHAACNSFTLAKALQFAIAARAQVLNLSLTGPDDRLLARLIDVALRQGAIVVGAVDARAADGGFPASHPGVLAVAREDQPGAHARVLAPGAGVPAPLPGGGWGLVSGDSFAAAEVSGLVAVLRQLSPDGDGAAVRAALQPAGVGSQPKRPEPIDACAAVVRLGHCACACTTAQAGRPMPRQ